jgi:hypothetical protein
MPRESSSSSFDWSKFGMRLDNVFTGAAGVTALQQLFNLATREIAVSLGLELQRQHYLHYASSATTLMSSNGNSQRDFVDSTRCYYILTPFRTPNVLNSLTAWPTTTTTATMPEELTNNNNKEEELNPMDIVKNLKKLWSKLESKYMNKNTGEIDYANIHADELYWQFEHDVCVLQCIPLIDDSIATAATTTPSTTTTTTIMTNMNDATVRKAYIINIYNLMIKYAFCKVGVPVSLIYDTII